MRVLTDEVQDMVALNHGSVQAFDAIYKRYHQAVYRNILKIVQSPEYAEEILQDVFVSLWQNRFRLRIDQPVGGWLFVVSFNKSMDLLKKKLKEHIQYVANYEQLSPMEDDDSDERNLLEKQMEILEEAVDKLSPRKREIFKLCRYEGYSKEDVADMLGISPRSVSDYLKQANQSIRKYISNHHPYSYGSSTLLLISMAGFM